jgi:hypothetical protein
VFEHGREQQVFNGNPSWMRLGCAVTLVVMAASARADEDSPEKAQARMLLSQGNQLFERGELRAALADFHAAYALFPSPKLLVNAAAAERELGELAGAATDLRHFLDDATDEESGLVEKARADLRVLERRVGRIALAGWPARTTMEIDSRAARDPTYVRPGTHQVRVRSPSGVELEREVDVGAGGSVEVAMPPGAQLREQPVPPPTRGVARKKRPGWVLPVAVVGALLVAGGAVTAGVFLGTQSAGKPLGSDLGIFSFSQFK